MKKTKYLAPDLEIMIFRSITDVMDVSVPTEVGIKWDDEMWN